MKKFTKNTRKWQKVLTCAALSAGLLLTGIPAAAQETEAAEQVQADASEQMLLPNGKSVYNMLLIGSDRRNESWNGNSDVMIVATVNAETKKLVLTSFMRDLYADIPGYGVHKLNYAYAAGGAEKLEETLEKSYDLEIDNHAIVDFETMSKIVDIVGGVDIEVSDAETEVLNMYLKSMDASEDMLSGGGMYHLNGKQAVAYMRIRYVGNNDYERTKRQREVLGVIFDSLRKLDAQALTTMVDEVLPQVDHNVEPLRMMRLIPMLSQFTDYELVENRIPYDDLYHSQNEMLVPDFGATIERLHETLYGAVQQ